MSELCCKLHQLFNILPVHGYPIDFNKLPQNGIYIVFETGELAHGTNRIVRVGTHNGLNQLRPRIQQHFIREHKDRSIFRKNIGRALLNRANDPFLSLWNLDLTTKAAKQKYSAIIDWDKQMQVERQVTEYMQSNFKFVVFEVQQPIKRLYWETRIISTISLCADCAPSEKWLGNYSPVEKIRQSGLWLVNGLYKQPLSPDEFDKLVKKVLLKADIPEDLFFQKTKNCE